jgi:two-component sensor histidine kinase
MQQGRPIHSTMFDHADAPVRPAPEAAKMPIQNHAEWSRAAALIVILIALTVLVVGWLAGVEQIRRLRPSFAAMAPSTAISFVLTGVSLLISASGPRLATALAIARVVCPCLVLAVALTDLLVIVSDMATGIDALIAPSAGAFQRGSMAPATAVAFLLASVSLLTAFRRSPGAEFAFVLCATLGLCIACIAVVGYVFDSHALYQISLFTAMALHTALCFIAVSLGMLLLRPDIGWVKYLLGSGTGSDGARRLFPFIVAGPLCLCMVALQATKMGILEANFRLSMLATAIIVLLAVMVLKNAAFQNEAERSLMATTDQLRSALADKEILLREVYHRVKNNLQLVNALIGIQSGEIDDPAAQNALRSVTERVGALGTVHQLLVSAGSTSELGIDQFLNELCLNIAAGYGAARRGITIEVDAENQQVEIDTAIALGLLVNELVSNAIKHAFVDDAGGSVRISYGVLESGRTQLVVRDTGKGMAAASPNGFPNGNTGAGIVQGLIAQLDAECNVETHGGTRVTIVFPTETECRVGA